MKRIVIAWLLLFCIVLSACAKVSDSGETVGTQNTAAAGSETEPVTTATTAPSAEVTPEPSAEVTTEATAEAATEPSAAPTESASGIVYQEVDPYPIPIANPDKDIYDAPDGNYLGDFNTIRYYTIVEQAKDSNGYLWGRLSTGEGWTMVYQQILPELDLFFASGAGAWGTSLALGGNGKFSASFHDSEMGDSDEAYPNGSRYICNFDGAFRVTDIDTYTVSLELTKLNSDYEEGKVWIEDGIRYISSEPYGLHSGTDYILYTPDTPVGILPEEMNYWWYDIPDSGTLGCYALYCPETGVAFFGPDGI